MPALYHLLRHNISERHGLLFRAIRPFMRQIKIPDGDFGRHSGRSTLTQNLDDLSDRRLPLTRLLHDLDHNHLARTGSGRVG